MCFVDVGNGGGGEVESVGEEFIHVAVFCAESDAAQSFWILVRAGSCDTDVLVAGDTFF